MNTLVIDLTRASFNNGRIKKLQNKGKNHCQHDCKRIAAFQAPPQLAFMAWGLDLGMRQRQE